MQVSLIVSGLLIGTFAIWVTATAVWLARPGLRGSPYLRSAVALPGIFLLLLSALIITFWYSRN
jgi:hypothetical protein